MGSLPGAMAGAAVLTWLPEFLQGPGAAARTGRCGSAPCCIAMMIFRPAGLIPAKRRQAELHRASDERRPRRRAEPLQAVPAGEGM